MLKAPFSALILMLPLALLLAASAPLVNAQLAPSTQQLENFRKELTRTPFVTDDGGVGTSGGGATAAYMHGTGLGSASRARERRTGEPHCYFVESMELMFLPHAFFLM